LAFKVKSTNNNDYRLKPVYGFVDATGCSPLEITRSAGPPKEDKLVIQFKEAAPDAADAAALFKEGAPLGELTLPLKAIEQNDALRTESTMGDAPPADAPPPPPPEGAPPAEGAAPPADAGAAPAGPPTLMADPPEANMPAAGGVSAHTLRNPSAVRLAFKVKSTNNNDYRLKPVYGFVDATGCSPLEITRSAGPPKEDKLVIQFKEAAPDAADAAALFKEGAPLGELTLPLKAM
uniref:Major sperm protein n=1 Tax=Toxocara canis TaxID=6265 RepID=A0A183U4N8_TOXCA